MEGRPIHPIECECQRCGTIVELAASSAPSHGLLDQDRLYFGLALLAASYFFGRVLVAVLS